MNSKFVDGDEVVAKPSRAEIESLCIVHVVSAKARSFVELAKSLGLSSDLAGVMEEAVSPLVEAGRLEVVDGEVRATELGRNWLRNRLSELKAH